MSAAELCGADVIDRRVAARCTVRRVTKQLRTRSSLLAGILTVSLIVGACGGSDTDEPDAENPSAPPASSETTTGDAESGGIVGIADLSDREAAVVADIVGTLTDNPAVWEGFDPTTYPMLVVLLDENDLPTSGFTVAHPSPESFGAASAVTGFDELDGLHYLPAVSGAPTPPLFDYVEAGGVKTVIMNSLDAGGEPLLGPGGVDIRQFLTAPSPLWQGFLLHEAFHFYQSEFWEERFVDQNTYDYELENFELALLEDKALIAAHESSGDDAAEAIAHFVALRSTRLDRFPSADLDETQEHIEGTAQWYEWSTTERPDPLYVDPASGDLSNAMQFAQFNAGGPPLERFYLSGALLMQILDDAEVEWLAAIEAGTTPSELVRESFPVDPADYDTLIAEARATYDPDGEFLDVAQVWADGAGGGGLEIPEDVLACLAEFDLTPDDLDDPANVTQDVVDACFGE